MTMDLDIYQQHSDKLLARALRTDPEYVSCIQCKAGGFFSGHCMQARQQERDQALMLKEQQIASLAGAFWVVALLLLLVFGLSDTPLWYSILGWLLLAACAELVAQVEQRDIERVQNAPVEVGCPECGASFVLANVRQQQENEQWVRLHSRPCPRCRAPIEKRGGCNHMVCSSCRARFCWACMREDRSCGAYNCKNGAPFGNAQPFRPQVSQTALLGQGTSIRLLHSLAFWSSCAGLLELVIQKHTLPIILSTTWRALTALIHWAVYVISSLISGSCLIFLCWCCCQCMVNVAEGGQGGARANRRPFALPGPAPRGPLLERLVQARAPEPWAPQTDHVQVLV